MLKRIMIYDRDSDKPLVEYQFSIAATITELDILNIAWTKAVNEKLVADKDRNKFAFQFLNGDEKQNVN